MNKTNDKRYVYFNEQKIVDLTVKQFFEDEHGGRSFSEFAKAILYHFAVENGFSKNVAMAAPPLVLAKKPKKNNGQIKKQVVGENKVPTKIEEFVTESDLESSTPPPVDDNMDDIMSAVKSIM